MKTFCAYRKLKLNKENNKLEPTDKPSEIVVNGMLEKSEVSTGRLDDIVEENIEKAEESSFSRFLQKKN